MDTVIVGEAESEYYHGYAGHDDSAGMSNGRTFRQARGWMRYAMTAFDDTQVTVACTFGPNEKAAEYEVVVEDSLVAAKTLGVSTAESIVVEVAVPFAVTKGRTSLAVTIRAKNGATPALRELRIIQDHHEQDPQLAYLQSHMQSHMQSNMQSQPVASFPKSQNPIGVAR